MNAKLHKPKQGCGNMSLNTTLLAQIAGDTQAEYSIKDLARASGVSTDTVRRAMPGLLAQGLVHRITGGRIMLYTAAPDNPAVTCFKVFTTIQSLQPLVKRLRPLAHRIVLYGPCATGADAPGSDINLFIVAPDPTAVLNITDTYWIPILGGSESRKVGKSESLRGITPFP